jgi:hypothetical protein
MKRTFVVALYIEGPPIGVDRFLVTFKSEESVAFVVGVLKILPAILGLFGDSTKVTKSVREAACFKERACEGLFNAQVVRVARERLLQGGD